MINHLHPTRWRIKARKKGFPGKSDAAIRHPSTDPQKVLKPEQLTALSPLQEDDFRTLLERAGTILNRYSSLFRAMTRSRVITGIGDYKFLIEAAKKRIAVLEAEMKPKARRAGKPVDGGG